MNQCLHTLRQAFFTGQEQQFIPNLLGLEGLQYCTAFIKTQLIFQISCHLTGGMGGHKLNTETGVAAVSFLWYPAQWRTIML